MAVEIGLDRFSLLFGEGAVLVGSFLFRIRNFRVI